MQIYHDDMETVGTMVQSIVSYFQIQSLESRAVFPAEFKEAEDIIAEVVLKIYFWRKPDFRWNQCTTWRTNWQQNWPKSKH